jgi:hypothetical protein
VYVPLLSKYPNRENSFPFTEPETNITFAIAEPEKVNVPLSAPAMVVCTVSELPVPSVRVAVTTSEPEGKFNVPENVPARLGTCDPTNVPESEQFEFVPEYVPEIVLPFMVPWPV